MVAFLSGCAKSGRMPVTGKVDFRDGQPVTFGIIEFVPTGPGKAARGKIEKDGSFSLRTGSNEGAEPGEYCVAILQPVIRDGLPDKARHHIHDARLVHSKYRRPETSELKAAVSETSRQFHFVVDAGI